MCVSRVRWNSRVVLHIMSMMRDVSLSSDELSHVIAKSLRQFTEIDQNELPPLVYQLLLLSAKASPTVACGDHLL